MERGQQVKIEKELRTEVKYLNLKTLVHGLMICAAAFASSCDNSSKSGTTVTAAARGGVPAANPNLFPVYGGYALGQGKIYADSYLSADFTTAVKAMLSAYIDPAAVGDVSPTDGIFFSAYVEPGANNGVNSAASGFEMDIRDSFALRGVNDNGEKIEPIRLGGNAVAMTVQNNRATVTFRTNNAEYIFEGTFDNNQYQGQVTVRNLKKFDGSAPSRPGVLGSFQIPTCQFFRCQ